MSETLQNKKFEAEIEKALAEVHNLNADTRKMFAEIEKMSFETAKIRKETFWHPLAVGAAVTGAIMAITKFFL